MHCCTCPFPYCSLQVRGFCQCTEQPQRTRRQGTIAVSDVAIGETCGIKAKKQAFVNIAAFLREAMIETIIYDACEYIRLDGSCH